MELQYFKTDRNGTKYFHDYTCPHCGGAGSADKWEHTGKICWQCGGTGRRAKPQIVKQYTPEYQAKLDAKRAAKAAALEAERKAAGYEGIMKRFGYNANGVKYVYCGNSYETKDALKAHGARWNWAIYRWTSIQPIEGFKYIEMNAADIFEYFDCCGWAESNAKLDAWYEAHKAELEY